MKFMHGVVHGKAPDYLCNLISLTDDNDVAYDFRNKENVTQFSFRTENFRKSLFPDCIRKWNELPVDLWKMFVCLFVYTASVMFDYYCREIIK